MGPSDMDKTYEYYSRHPELTGYHEAAHAVVAWRCGWEIGSVEVGRTGTHGVSTLIRRTDDPAERLIVHLAGVRGERRCRSWDPDLAGAGEDDAGEVAAAARELGVSRMAPFEALVDEILYDDRRGLSRLAERLVEQRRVDGKEAVNLLTTR